MDFNSGSSNVKPGKKKKTGVSNVAVTGCSPEHPVRYRIEEKF